MVNITGLSWDSGKKIMWISSLQGLASYSDVDQVKRVCAYIYACIYIYIYI